MMAQQTNPMPMAQASHMGASSHATAPLLIQLFPTA